MKNPKVYFKPMKDYAEAHLDTNKIYIDPKKFKGITGLDTITHEKNHLSNKKMSERDIIKKTKKDVKSYLSII